MNAADLKCAVLAWLRYKRQCNYVCTEVGHYSADVWGIDDNRLIEVETKISIADLRADFNKDKHKSYQDPKFGGIVNSGTSVEAVEPTKVMNGSVPSLFYFCLPNELVAQAEEYLTKKAFELPVIFKYGILSYTSSSNSYFGDNVVVHRKAVKLHKLKPGPGCFEIAAKRMSSEICSLHRNVRLQVEAFASSNKYLSDTFRRLYDAERQQKVPELEEGDEVA